MFRYYQTTGPLAVFLVTGGAWVLCAVFLPDGPAHTAGTLAVGLAFAVAFQWVLINQVRRIYSRRGRAWHHGLAAAGVLLLFLSAFAAAYTRFGVIDDTRAGSPLVHDFLPCAYLSVVTFTTLGYGDFYPSGLGRALAGLEALSGFVVLGVLASTAASIVRMNVERTEADE